MNEAYRMYVWAGGVFICVWRLANHRVWNSSRRKTLVLAPTRWRHDPGLFVLNSQASRSTSKGPLLSTSPCWKSSGITDVDCQTWLYVGSGDSNTGPSSSQHKRILESLNLIFQDQTESTHSTKDGNESKW